MYAFYRAIDNAASRFFSAAFGRRARRCFFSRLSALLPPLDWHGSGTCRWASKGFLSARRRRRCGVAKRSARCASSEASSAVGSWSCWSLRFMSVQAFASRSGSTARGVSVAGLTAAELKAHSVCRREGGRAGEKSRGAARIRTHNTRI